MCEPFGSEGKAIAVATVKWYGLALKSAFNREVDFDTDVIKAMFTATAHVPDQDLHQYKSSLTNEVTGTNWVAGGVTLTTCQVVYTGATNVTKFTADNISVATVTFTDAKNIHIYDNTPATDATRPLLFYGVLDAALNPNAGTVTVTWDTAGIVTATAA